VKYEDWFKLIFESEDYITTDKYLSGSLNLNYKYVKTDYLRSFGRWRGAIQIPLILRQLISFDRVVVCGHSDIPLGSQSLQYLRNIGFRKVFGVNTLNQDDYSESIPIGLTNNCDDSPIHRVLGDVTHFHKAHEHTNVLKSFDATVYVNFTTSNNISERAKLLAILGKMNSVKYGSVEINEIGRIEFLRSLRENALVPAPEGNGFDTHRLWETLYMGGTPVIKRCAYLPHIVDRLPVIVLDDWGDLQNLNLIEVEWEKAQTKRSSWKYLTSSYWIERIAQSSQKVER